MGIVYELKEWVLKALKDLYALEMKVPELTVSITKPEFEGDYTLVLFPFVKQLRKSPDLLGKEIGDHLLAAGGIVTQYNVIKGFLNLTVSDPYWMGFLAQNYDRPEWIRRENNGRKVIVEYSSPNTNKPLHLGHLRNNFLGWSVAEILKTTGCHVVKTAILNDRGIHICKSMVAWQQFADGATPDSTGIKGDHFVGDFYVKGENTIKEQAALIRETLSTGGSVRDMGETESQLARQLQLRYDEATVGGGAEAGEPDERKTDEAKKISDQLNEIARNNTDFMRSTKQMLLDWEAGEPAVRALWERMNSWVYEGFNETYKKIGSDFDQNYFESETYLLGKEFVEDGLARGVFFKKEDGSVWIDLTPDGLDEKLVLRKDGTSVYITQDLGLADRKYEQFRYDDSIYVIADEQNYHMKVLKLILEKLGKPYAGGIHHLSYGLVELPSGRMKTREGTVVDADDLIEELKIAARAKTEEHGKVGDLNPGELNELYDMIALGALKFFILRVDARKKMIFNPEESIDFQGFTGPFIQWTHARIRSILRKEGAGLQGEAALGEGLLPKEKAMIVLIEQFRLVLDQSLHEFNPSVIAIFAFEVAKQFNSFYIEHSVKNAESPEKKNLRLRICQLTAATIASAMGLLGIRVPDKM